MSDLELAQQALATEHAVIYGYGLLGARLDLAARQLATQGEDAHRARRDLLRRFVLDRRGAPVAAEPAYAAPFPVPDMPAGLRLASQLEDAVAATYRAVVVATDDRPLRQVAVEALQDAAVRATRFRLLAGLAADSVTSAFPGQT
ncbi:MAG: ferritin-like domain-containing protein [Actinomycetota bacterium]|nr:ferritin-like domain-containing protein [Actinomycetota bacterium]